MKAPWQEYPDYKPHSMGFRMGGGEDYIQDWWKFWDGLKHTEKEKFVALNPPPSEEWKTYCPLE
jgi:hypothetical protein